MTEAPEDQAGSHGFGRLLRGGLFYLTLIALPLGIYFVFYVDTRLEHTAERNFRALDAAAERLETIVGNMHKIAGNIPVDVSPEVLDRIAGRVKAGSANRDTSTTEVLDTLSKISRDYLDDFAATRSSADFTVRPFLLHPEGVGEAAGDDRGQGQPNGAGQKVSDSLLRAGSAYCSAPSPGPAGSMQIARRLVASDSGTAVEIAYCEPFSTRSPQLAAAIPADQEEVIAVLDQYGVSVIGELEGLVESVAANVAPLFDQYLIADSAGKVLYSVEKDRFRYQGVTGAPMGRRARRDFAAHVDVAELVRRSAIQGGSELNRSLEQLGLDGLAQAQEFGRYGIHSRVADFQVADVPFQAFIHPFKIEGLAPLSASAGGAETSSVLYMIGIASRAELARESKELRLSLVAHALLGIAVLFASLALLWLWTAGDRLLLGFRHLLLFLATGIAVTLLYNMLALHFATRVIDDLAFDRALARTGMNIQRDFRREMAGRLDALAIATRKMLEFGETPARLGNSNPPSTDNGKSATPLQQQIEDQYFCRPPRGSAWPPDSSETINPGYDLAFLLDNTGRQWQCLSYRLADTRPISLDFRKYYRHPRDGRLWRAALGETAPAGGSGQYPGFFMDRITSILDGTTETVISARPDELCRYLEDKKLAPQCPPGIAFKKIPAAVIIGRLHSLENTVTLPHMHFAVVDNQSGRTLFHSTRSRALASNFIGETRADSALMALIDSGIDGFAKLNYHGTSIRAHIQPLAKGIPWTLVTYRDHSLADTLGVMAVSLTTAYVIAALFAVAVALMLIVAGWRMSSQLAWRWRETVLSAEFLRLAPGYMAAYAAVTTCLLLLVAMRWPHWGGRVAFATIAGGFSLLVLLTLWRIGRERGDNAPYARHIQDRVAPERRRLVVLLLTVLLTTTILPTFGWYMQVRGALSAGLADYLHTLAASDIDAKCQRQNAFARRYKPGAIVAGPTRDGIFDRGWALTEPLHWQTTSVPASCEPYPGAIAQLRHLAAALATGTAATPVRGSSLIWAVGGFSGLAGELSAHTLYSDPKPVFSRPGQVLGAALESGTDTAAAGKVNELLQVTHRTGFGLLVILLLLGLGLFYLVIVSIVDRVLGMCLRLGLLPPCILEPLPRRWTDTGGKPLRAVVVHRAEDTWQALIEKFLDQRYQAVNLARWHDNSLCWDRIHRDRSLREGAADTPSLSTVSASELFVVSGMERFIVNGDAGGALLAALEAISAGPAGILICTRIVPGYWLANISDQESSDISDASRQLDLSSRWSQVLGPFDVRRLSHPTAAVDAQFEQSLKKYAHSQLPENHNREVRRAMLLEARANPAMADLAAAVAGRVCGSEQPRRGCPARIALQRFRAGAASYFYTLWAASSREERLQLLAMAQAGFANPTQATTLASLANRGLIYTNGIIRLRSEAFGQFIARDLEHDALLRWRDQGHGNIWRSLWPPVVLIVLLAMAFFITSNPAALAPLAAILAASLGAIPVISSLLRGLRDLRPEPGDG